MDVLTSHLNKFLQFLVILNALLPVGLEILTKLEGAISGSLIEASLFLKLTAFTIIQVRKKSLRKILTSESIVSFTHDAVYFVILLDVLCVFIVRCYSSGDY